MISKELFNTLAAARRDVYAFLSWAFREPPSADAIQVICGNPFVMEEGKNPFGRELGTALHESATIARQEDWQESSRLEFMRLFKVPGAQYVTPYESVFRDIREIDGKPVGGLLAGPSARAVKQWYRLAAVDVSEGFKDLPDHVSLELSYMAHLCQKDLEFAAEGDQPHLLRAREMQRDFLAGHLATWIGLLDDTLREKTQHPYFRAVGTLAAQFTLSDKEVLEELIGPSQGNPLPEYKASE